MLNGNPRLFTVFPICTKFKHKYIGTVYPLKQKQVGLVIENLQNDSRVKKLYIFGSSVSDRCRRFSDIDIAVMLYDEYLTYENKNSIYLIISKCIHSFDKDGYVNQFDLIFMDEVKSDRLYSEIVKKGVRFI